MGGFTNYYSIIGPGSNKVVKRWNILSFTAIFGHCGVSERSGTHGKLGSVTIDDNKSSHATLILLLKRPYSHINFSDHARFKRNWLLENRPVQRQEVRIRHE